MIFVTGRRINLLVYWSDVLAQQVVNFREYYTQMNSLLSLAEQLGQVLTAKGLLLATAESCTGGEVAQVITSIPGSSAWFERGFVTYSNTAKMEMLGVPSQTLMDNGAVSEQTVCAMAEGALQHSPAHFSVAITGIAGPGGGTAEKPVGTVWFSWAAKHRPTLAKKQFFSGDRQSVRDQATRFALEQLLSFVQS